MVAVAIDATVLSTSWRTAAAFLAPSILQRGRGVSPCVHVCECVCLAGFKVKVVPLVFDKTATCLGVTPTATSSETFF